MKSIKFNDSNTLYHLGVAMSRTVAQQGAKIPYDPSSEFTPLKGIYKFIDPAGEYTALDEQRREVPAGPPGYGSSAAQIHQCSEAFKLCFNVLNSRQKAIFIEIIYQVGEYFLLLEQLKNKQQQVFNRSDIDELVRVLGGIKVAIGSLELGKKELSIMFAGHATQVNPARYVFCNYLPGICGGLFNDTPNAEKIDAIIAILQKTYDNVNGQGPKLTSEGPKLTSQKSEKFLGMKNKVFEINNIQPSSPKGSGTPSIPAQNPASGNGGGPGDKPPAQLPSSNVPSATPPIGVNANKGGAAKVKKSLEQLNTEVMNFLSQHPAAANQRIKLRATVQSIADEIKGLGNTQENSSVRPARLIELLNMKADAMSCLLHITRSFSASGFKSDDECAQKIRALRDKIAGDSENQDYSELKKDLAVIDEILARPSNQDKFQMAPAANNSNNTASNSRAEINKDPVVPPAPARSPRPTLISTSVASKSEQKNFKELAEDAKLLLGTNPIPKAQIHELDRDNFSKKVKVCDELRNKLLLMKGQIQGVNQGDTSAIEKAKLIALLDAKILAMGCLMFLNMKGGAIGINTLNIVSKRDELAAKISALGEDESADPLKVDQDAINKAAELMLPSLIHMRNNAALLIKAMSESIGVLAPQGGEPDSDAAAKNAATKKVDAELERFHRDYKRRDGDNLIQLPDTIKTSDDNREARAIDLNVRIEVTKHAAMLTKTDGEKMISQVNKADSTNAGQINYNYGITPKEFELYRTLHAVDQDLNKAAEMLQPNNLPQASKASGSNAQDPIAIVTALLDGDNGLVNKINQLDQQKYNVITDATPRGQNQGQKVQQPKATVSCVNKMYPDRKQTIDKNLKNVLELLAAAAANDFDNKAKAALEAEGLEYSDRTIHLLAGKKWPTSTVVNGLVDEVAKLHAVMIQRARRTNTSELASVNQANTRALSLLEALRTKASELKNEEDAVQENLQESFKIQILSELITRKASDDDSEIKGIKSGYDSLSDGITAQQTIIDELNGNIDGVNATQLSAVEEKNQAFDSEKQRLDVLYNKLMQKYPSGGEAQPIRPDILKDLVEKQQEVTTQLEKLKKDVEGIKAANLAKQKELDEEAERKAQENFLNQLQIQQQQKLRSQSRSMAAIMEESLLRDNGNSYLCANTTRASVEPQDKNAEIKRLAQNHIKTKTYKELSSASNAVCGSASVFAQAKSELSSMNVDSSLRSEKNENLQMLDKYIQNQQNLQPLCEAELRARAQEKEQFVRRFGEIGASKELGVASVACHRLITEIRRRKDYIPDGDQTLKLAVDLAAQLDNALLYDPSSIDDGTTKPKPELDGNAALLEEATRIDNANCEACTGQDRNGRNNKSIEEAASQTLLGISFEKLDTAYRTVAGSFATLKSLKSQLDTESSKPTSSAGDIDNFIKNQENLISLCDAVFKLRDHMKVSFSLGLDAFGPIFESDVTVEQLVKAHAMLTALLGNNNDDPEKGTIYGWAPLFERPDDLPERACRILQTIEVRITQEFVNTLPGKSSDEAYLSWLIPLLLKQAHDLNNHVKNEYASFEKSFVKSADLKDTAYEKALAYANAEVLKALATGMTDQDISKSKHGIDFIIRMLEILLDQKSLPESLRPRVQAALDTVVGIHRTVESQFRRLEMYRAGLEHYRNYSKYLMEKTAGKIDSGSKVNLAKNMFGNYFNVMNGHGSSYLFTPQQLSALKDLFDQYLANHGLNLYKEIIEAIQAAMVSLGDALFNLKQVENLTSLEEISSKLKAVDKNLKDAEGQISTLEERVKRLEDTDPYKKLFNEQIVEFKQKLQGYRDWSDHLRTRVVVGQPGQAKIIQKHLAGDADHNEAARNIHRLNIDALLYLLEECSGENRNKVIAKKDVDAGYLVITDAREGREYQLFLGDNLKGLSNDGMTNEWLVGEIKIQIKAYLKRKGEDKPRDDYRSVDRYRNLQQLLEQKYPSSNQSQAPADSKNLLTLIRDAIRKRTTDLKRERYMMQIFGEVKPEAILPEEIEVARKKKAEVEAVHPGRAKLAQSQSQQAPEKDKIAVLEHKADVVYNEKGQKENVFTLSMDKLTNEEYMDYWNASKPLIITLNKVHYLVTVAPFHHAHDAEGEERIGYYLKQLGEGDFAVSNGVVALSAACGQQFEAGSLKGEKIEKKHIDAYATSKPGHTLGGLIEKHIEEEVLIVTMDAACINKSQSFEGEKPEATGGNLRKPSSSSSSSK